MQTPKIINAFFLSCFLCFGLFSCDVTRTEVDYIPDVKGLEQEMSLIRFEQDFFSLDTTNLYASLQNLKEKYPEFTQGFLSTVIGARDSASENRIVKGYLNYPDALFTYDTVQQVFQDLSTVQTQLNELATYYHYYFPDAKPLSKAFTYLSEYHGDRLVILEDGLVGLPLDMALGEGYSPYIYLKIPSYDQRTCNKEHLVAKAADAVAQTIISEHAQAGGNHLIDQMLYNGKIFYLTDLLLPTVADSLKFGFSSFQMEFCKEGELTLYVHISEEELMYASETKLISKYITKGPFKPQLDLPGNSGSWLGYRMVRAFANHQRTALSKTNPNLSKREIDQKVLDIVLKENDPQKFLQLYKPPKH